jgi:Carboxypeptidase regulatory-like domain
MRLPTDEMRFNLTGRLQFADGAPVAGAEVTFRSPQHGYSETTTTGADGTFGLSALAGMDGRMNAQLAIMEPILKSCPEFAVGPHRRGIFRFVNANRSTS